MSTNATEHRIIWIAPKFPLGAPDGARYATHSLIRHLTLLQARIELVCLVPHGESTDVIAAMQQMGVVSCHIIERSRSKFLPYPFWKTPYTFRTFSTARVRTAFNEILADLVKDPSLTRNTVLVFDGLHTFGALSDLDLQALSHKVRGIVYRAHNFETTFWQQCAQMAHTPWFRWFYQYQTMLVRNFERRIARSVSWIAPVSEEDAERFKRLAPEAAVTVIPIGLDIPDGKTVQPVMDSDTLNLAFIGRLDWRPNRAGLLWFLENVWPALKTKRTEATLHIAGTGDSRWLQKFKDLPGITFLGRVDHVEPFYQSSALSIAPLFQGSGTRVKILESARYARACISTSLGAEGTRLVPGISYFRAETQKEWLALLETVTVDACRAVGLKAFQSIQEQFNSRVITEKFLSSLEQYSITNQPVSTTHDPSNADSNVKADLTRLVL